MYALEISPLEEDNDLILEETLNEVDTVNNDEPELLMSECYPQISLNTLSGIPTFNTMRMKANVAKHILHLLLDTRKIMAGTRNLLVEPYVDDSIKNWVSDHVTQVTNEFNQKFDTVNTSLNDILSQLHFVVNYVNRLRRGE
nr:hypothetical protein [Tanacetum cinerariifolium]